MTDSPSVAPADPVRVALVGAGRMGRVHLRALQAAAGIAPVAVVEPVAAIRDTLSAEGLVVYETVDELLAAGQAEAALVAAPSDLHPELVRTFAAVGMPLLCEKPVGVHASDAVAATRAAEQAGIVLQIGYWRRFVPGLRNLRDRIGAGELGEISAMTCLQWDATPPSTQFRARSGGIAVDMAVHELDQARWMLGQEVEWLCAAPASAEAADPVAARDPDAATVLAQFSGGTAVTISLGRHFPHGDCCWVEVFGTAGYERQPFMWAQEGDRVFHEALVAQAEAFAAAVRGGAPAGATGEDAIAALTAAELIGEALADGRKKELPRPAVMP
jgi:myo-inositol 2-dehydrogenase/D-chiro-inositol 1-dehydrogenase